jgi:hypothetical protein
MMTHADQENDFVRDIYRISRIFVPTNVHEFWWVDTVFSKEKLTGEQTIACAAKCISLVVEVCALPVHKICSVKTLNYATSVHYDILLCTSDNIVHIC